MAQSVPKASHWIETPRKITFRSGVLLLALFVWWRYKSDGCLDERVVDLAQQLWMGSSFYEKIVLVSIVLGAFCVQAWYITNVGVLLLLWTEYQLLRLEPESLVTALNTLTSCDPLLCLCVSYLGLLIISPLCFRIEADLSLHLVLVWCWIEARTFRPWRRARQRQALELGLDPFVVERIMEFRGSLDAEEDFQRRVSTCIQQNNLEGLLREMEAVAGQVTWEETVLQGILHVCTPRRRTWLVTRTEEEFKARVLVEAKQMMLYFQSVGFSCLVNYLEDALEDPIETETRANLVLAASKMSLSMCLKHAGYVFGDCTDETWALCAMARACTAVLTAYPSSVATSVSHVEALIRNLKSHGTISEAKETMEGLEAEFESIL